MNTINLPTAAPKWASKKSHKWAKKDISEVVTLTDGLLHQLQMHKKPGSHHLVLCRREDVKQGAWMQVSKYAHRDDCIPNAVKATKEATMSDISAQDYAEFMAFKAFKASLVK